MDNNLIETLKRHLGPRSYEYLNLFFGLEGPEHTLEEIADIMKVNKNSARGRIWTTLHRLKTWNEIYKPLYGYPESKRIDWEQYGVDEDYSKKNTVSLLSQIKNLSSGRKV